MRCTVSKHFQKRASPPSLWHCLTFQGQTLPGHFPLPGEKRRDTGEAGEPGPPQESLAALAQDSEAGSREGSRCWVSSQEEGEEDKPAAEGKKGTAV